MSGDSKTKFQTLQHLSCSPTRTTLFSTVLYIVGLLKIFFEKLFNYFKTMNDGDKMASGATTVVAPSLASDPADVLLPQRLFVFSSLCFLK